MLKITKEVSRLPLPYCTARSKRRMRRTENQIDEFIMDSTAYIAAKQKNKYIVSQAFQTLFVTQFAVKDCNKSGLPYSALVLFRYL